LIVYSIHTCFSFTLYQHRTVSGVVIEKIKKFQENCPVSAVIFLYKTNMILLSRLFSPTATTTTALTNTNNTIGNNNDPTNRSFRSKSNNGSNNNKQQATVVNNNNSDETPKPRQTIDQKMVIVGARECGKSALLNRFVNDDFADDYMQTLSVDYLHKRIPLNVYDVVFCLFDVGIDKGDDATMALAVLDASCIIFTFDLSRPESLDWIQENYKSIKVRNNRAINCLVGTKFDQFLDLDVEEQTSTTIKAKEFAKLMNCPLIYTSSSHSINVQKVFKICLSLVFGIDPRMEQVQGDGEPLLILNVASQDA
jgi:GTP-binding protein of the ras superfamily involved in termination of M-phase